MNDQRTPITTWAIIAVPILYYLALIGGALTYPGYSHVTRYASELGAADAPYPGLFNYSIIAAGFAGMLGGYGLFAGLVRIGGLPRWAAMAGLSLALWGAAMVVGGSFPMPDDRHGAYGLGLAGQLTPLLTLLAIRRLPDAGGFRLLLAAVFLVSTGLLAVMMGVGELVTTRNVGLWQRAYSGASIAWLALLGLWLQHRLRERRRVAG